MVVAVFFGLLFYGSNVTTTSAYVSNAPKNLLNNLGHETLSSGRSIVHFLFTDFGLRETFKFFLSRLILRTIYSWT